MAACTRCNLCAAPGTLEQAEESGPVPCNVRRHKENIFTYWRCRNCGSLHCAEDADLAHYYQHVGSSRVDLQACKLEYSIVSPK